MSAEQMQKAQKMLAPPPLLRLALRVSAGYFCAMATAHYSGLKYPILFVYYDTPFHAYQDKIISFAVCAYIGLFHAASNYRPVVKTAVAVMAATTAGLASVNASDALASVLQPGQSTTPYWLQTAMIGAITAALAVLEATQ